jgi:hypothetical protein
MRLTSIVLALTSACAGFAIGHYRQRSILLPEIECAYHEGTNEGYRDGIADSQRIEEDDPRWDCHTMGNRICGDGDTGMYPSDHTTRSVTKSARK